MIATAIGSGPCSPPDTWLGGALVDAAALPGWRAERADGRALALTVRHADDDVLHISVADPDGGPVRLVVALAAAERIAGFGEQYGDVDVRGRVIDGWSEDLLQTGPRGTYFPAALWHSSLGYAAVVDTFAHFRADIGAAVGEELRLDVPESTLSAWVLLGPPKATLPRLRELLGAATTTPDWALGVWSSARSGTAAVLAECDRALAADLPITAMWVDDPWIPEDNLGCGAPGTYPKGEYPDARALVAGIHARGMKALGYLNCALYVDTPWDDEAQALGLHVRLADGTPYRYHFFHPGRQAGGMLAFEDGVAGSVDFSNPTAVTWWRGKIRGLLADGWDGWMQDFGEQVPEAAVLADGSDGGAYHNRYPIDYHAATNAERLASAEDTLFFVRSGHLGVQRHAPVMWGGDQSVDWGDARGLPSVLMAGVSAGLCGVPVWAPDVVGIVELPYPDEDADYDTFLTLPEVAGERGLDRELWLRWLEYGALTPTLRIHLGFKPRAGAPVDLWTDAETTAAFRRLARLHLRLYPYLRTLAAEAANSGLPVLRGLMIEFPDDPRSWDISDQYLLGEAILVAPVVTRGATARTVHFPDGTWEHLLTGERFEGPGEHEVAAPVGTVPAFQRAGTILPLLPEEAIVAGDALTGPRWRAGDFPVELRVVDDVEATARLFDGTVLRVAGGHVVAESTPSPSPARSYAVVRGTPLAPGAAGGAGATGSTRLIR